MADGLLLGFLTYLSIVFSFRHFPEGLQNFLLRHFILADILSIGITFLGLSAISHSLTAVIGAVVAGLLVNITQFGMKKFRPELFKKKLKDNSKKQSLGLYFISLITRKRRDVSTTGT